MGHGSVDHFASLAVTGTAQEVSNLPAYIAVLELFNNTAAPAYFQVFWKAVGSVVVGTTVPDMVLPMPASGGAVIPFYGEGLKTRGTAWTIASTTTRTGAVSAACDIVIWKKN